MNIIINKEKSTVIATVTFDKKEWNNAQEKAYQRLAANVTVAGFRKGKAPLELAKKQIDGRKMIDKAVDILVGEGNEKVLEENKLELLMRPSVDVKNLSEDELVIEYTYVVRPEVKLGQYKDIEIKVEEAVVTEEDLNVELKALQNKNVEIKVKETACKVGNIVNIDFKGFVNNVAFEGGEAKAYDLEIGSNQFIPGFEEQLVGVVAGQELSINVTFPQQYSKELAGKDAVFQIKVNSVSEKVVPEINDDLALDANIEGVNNLEELKAHLEKGVKERKTKEAEQAAFTKLLDTIINGSEVEVPAQVVEEEAKNQLEGFKKNVEERGIPYETYLEVSGQTEEDLLAQMRVEAEKNLKSSFVFQEISNVEKVTVTSEDIENEFQKIAAQYNIEYKKVVETLSPRVNELANSIYQNKLTTLLRSLNKIA